MSGTKEIWKKRVASWRASGKTAEKYSAGRAWSAGTLLWWSSRLGREAAPPAVRIAQLVRSPAPQDRLPDVRKRLRDRHLRVHVVSFFEFVETAYEQVKHQRGMLRSALGYCIRQKDALMRFLDDGALEMPAKFTAS